MLSDECEIKTEDIGDPKVEVKKPAEILSDSLQNPSDPDATYSGHKGPGYQVQTLGILASILEQKGGTVL